MLSEESRVINLDLGFVAKSLVDRRGWNPADASDAVLRYKRFLLLILRHPDKTLAPAPDIDEAWHSHILFTRQYMRDTESVFGGYLHHAPASASDSYEGVAKKCHPYWEGLLFPESDGAWRLEIPSERGAHSIRAYDLAHWRDHQGIAPAELLDLILKIRGELEEIQGLLAVHCSAGVGRTGTFLAALAIVDAIDRDELFSVEEIVYRLSLQRIQSVAKAPQYVTLHRLAELYLSKGSTGRPTPPDQAL